MKIRKNSKKKKQKGKDRVINHSIRTVLVNSLIPITFLDNYFGH